MNGNTKTVVGGVPGTVHPLYSTWRGMIRRCHDPRTSAFDGYGGRGIRVCDRWRHSFETFLSDVGPRPSPKHSIDRFPDNDGNYEPGNVRWATPKEQSNNRRTVGRLSTWKDDPHCEAIATLRLLVRNGLTVESIVADTGATQPTVLPHCLAIYRLYGVPITDWLTPSERLIAFGASSQNEPFAVHADALSPKCEAG